MNHGDDWVSVRILRQDHPAEASYWQSFLIRREPGLNVTGVLQHIATESKTASGENVAPVAYDANCLEEVCGSCTMLGQWSHSTGLQCFGGKARGRSTR